MFETVFYCRVQFYLQQACAEVSQILRMDLPYSPSIAYIIVSKRINTRFFMPGQRGAANPPCGLVCDNTVTLNERYDFFLVSQKANQGTVSPTSFNIIEDTTGITPDKHQKLAYILTHLYYNWAVRLTFRLVAFLGNQDTFMGNYYSTGNRLVSGKQTFLAIVFDTRKVSQFFQQFFFLDLFQGTLRVPAPCQYAHKLAYLIGESIMRPPHRNLACLPYYL